LQSSPQRHRFALALAQQHTFFSQPQFSLFFSLMMVCPFTITTQPVARHYS
jgi:hypothetical protein